MFYQSLTAMIDSISFWYRTDDPEHIEKLTSLMKGHISIGMPIHMTSKSKADNPIYPLRLELTPNNIVRVSGSIHKYWNAPNYTNDTIFTWKNFENAIFKLMAELRIDLKWQDPQITNLEIGLNYMLAFNVDEFLASLVYFKNHPFQYSKPARGSVKKWGKESVLTDYKVKFYNKAWLINKELKSTKYLDERLLRFEITYGAHLQRNLKFSTITGLLKSMDIIKTTLKDFLKKVEMKSYTDYRSVSIEDIFCLEGYTNPEFSFNTRQLPKNTKQKLKRKYESTTKRLKSFPTKHESVLRAMILEVDALC